jgi:hypothetical protein
MAASSLSMMSMMKNAWSMTPENHNDVLGEDEYIDNVEEVYMLELVRGANMRPGATSFETAFDAENAEHAYAEATLQLMLHVASVIRTAHTKGMFRATETTEDSSGGEPFAIYLEAVLSSVPDPRMPDANNFQTEEHARRRFMSGVPENIPVVAYRFWFFSLVAHDQYNFSRIFMETIKESAISYAEFNSPALRAKRGGKGSGEKTPGASSADTAASLSSYAGSEGVKYGQTLSESEKYRRIYGLDVWVSIADMLLGIRRLKRPEHMAKIMSTSTSITDNPANPRYVLSPLLYFRHPHKYADQRQQDIRNYMVLESGRRFKFAIHNCVLKVSARDEPIPRFTKKYIPDYQLRAIGDDAIDAITQRRRANEVSHLRRRRLGSAANGVLERAMVHRTLPIGAAGDIDIVAPSAAAVADGVEDPWMVSVYDLPEQPRARQCIGSVQLPAITAGRVVGGSDVTSILRVLDSIPDTTPDGDYELVDAEVLAREDFEGSTSLASMHLMSATDYPGRSHFHLVLHTGARLRAELSGLIAASNNAMPREERRARYLHNQMRIFRDYEDLCMSRTSNVSEPGKKINAWFEHRLEEHRAWLGHDEPALDAELSTFGNMMARRMLRLDAIMYITFAHAIIMLLAFGTLDVYRHAFDLKFNALLTGPNSAGKSYVCKLVAELRVPHTVCKMDDETKRAAYVDTDANDAINYMEEVKPEQFMDSAHGGNDTMEASLKERLTSGLCVLITFWAMPDGRRSSRVIYSQRTTSLIGCSNIPFKRFSEPIQSRFTCINFVEVKRDDRDTADIEGIEKTMTEEARQLRAVFLSEMCAEQYLHYHVEKLISSHALTEVTTFAFDCIKQIVRRYLSQRFMIQVHPRTMTRARAVLRKLVITTRYTHLFSSPFSRHFRKDFSVYQLADLDPLLYDDEEMACWAIEAFRHEFIDTTRLLVLSLAKKAYIDPAIADIMRSSTQGDRRTLLRSVYLVELTQVKRARYGSNYDHEDEQVDAPRKSMRTSSFQLESIAASSAQSVTEDAEQLYDESYMNAYYRFGVDCTTLAQRIAAESTSTPTQITAAEVRTHFREMSKQFVKSAGYSWNIVSNAPYADPTKERATIPALIYTTDAVFIAIQLFSETDPLHEAIKYARSMHLTRARKYVTANTLDANHPYLYATTRVAPADGRQHRIIQHGRIVGATAFFGYASVNRTATAESLRQKNGQMELPLHYDELSRRQRAISLFLDPDIDGAADGICSVERYERYERELAEPGSGERLRRYVLDEAGDYPQCVIKMDKRIGGAAAAAPMRVQAAKAPPPPPSMLDAPRRIYIENAE